MKTILLKFSGPLQSWGTSSSFETRHTDLYPSKSAVIGLVAASLGYRRDDDIQIQRLNSLKFAVRCDQRGELLRDYHTAKKYKKNGELDTTYVTNRYYLSDAIFMVTIGHEDPEYVETIAEGLSNPYFQTFMGRRALPLTADYFLGVFDSDVVSLLKEYPWQASNYYRNAITTSDQLSIYTDWTSAVDGKRVGYRRDRVISFSQKGRSFSFRTEMEIKTKAPNLPSILEHDAFAVLGD
ncbi:MAG: type I-E CRISPR-associated protein Cas5/CasD [Gallicola sp.]|nr:type I-E CRISPR-associated protein Cas5/CasD [Gallicola sp.]